MAGHNLWRQVFNVVEDLKNVMVPRQHQTDLLRHRGAGSGGQCLVIAEREACDRASCAPDRAMLEEPRRARRKLGETLVLDAKRVGLFCVELGFVSDCRIEYRQGR